MPHQGKRGRMKRTWMLVWIDLKKCKAYDGSELEKFNSCNQPQHSWDTGLMMISGVVYEMG